MKNESERKSQNDLIRKRLASGKAITQLAAMQDYGRSRLAARIYDLKNEGMTIDKRMVLLPSGKRIASYREAR
jgi:biotin operon repressor